MSFQVDEWVEVRTKEEILRTLDKNGRFEDLPFMPQMFQYCGQRFKVYKRAHKTCDTVSGKLEIRKIPGTVHLEHRCDGKAYGGCQAGCLIFWKEAWLKPVGGENTYLQKTSETPKPNDRLNPDCTVDAVFKGTQQQRGKETRYTCQATQLLHYSAPLKWWDPRQYVEDYRSGNATVRQIMSVFLFFAYRYGTFAKSAKFGRPARWLYDRVQALYGGIPYPRREGTVQIGRPVPVKTLNLRPGELVRIKSYPEILDTINTRNLHLGLGFDAEMVPFCGRTYRVRTRVERFIDEPTGIMKTLKTPAIILEGVFCLSYYSGKRMVCPRAILPWWHEVWLERVEGEAELKDPAETPKIEQCSFAR